MTTYDAAYYEDPQGRTRGVLIEVADQLQVKTVELVAELIDANEPGIALEMLSEALVEVGAILAPATVVAAEELVETMKLDQDVARRLQPLVRTAPSRDEPPMKE